MSDGSASGSTPAPAGGQTPGPEGNRRPALDGDQRKQPALDGDQGKGLKANEGQQTPPPKKEKRYLTAKTDDGREERVDEETLLKSYQKMRASEKREAELTQKEKSIQAFIQRLQQDPESVLADPRLPLDRKKLAVKWLQQQVQEELQFDDPRDRTIHELNQRLKQIDDEKAQAEQSEAEQAETQKRQQATKERMQHFETVFSKAMELSPLSKDPETAPEALRAMALHYRLAKSRGYEPDPQELAQAVEKKFFKSMYSAAGNLSGDDLIAFLGPQIINKIRLYDLDQIRKKREAPAPDTEQNWNSQQRSNRRSESGPVDPHELIRMSRGK